MSFGLVEQPGSRTRIGTDGMEFVFKCRRGEGAGHFADFVRLAETNGLHGGMYVDIDSSRLSPGETYDTLHIVGSTSPKFYDYSGTDRPDGETTYNLSITWMDRPIGMLLEYYTCWDHDLYASIEATDEAFANPPPHYHMIPIWWMTAKDTNIPIEDQLKYRWGQSQPSDQTLKINGISKTYRWVLLMPRELPGTLIKNIACPTVIEKIYFRSESKANAALKKGNMLLAPKKTYIYNKANKHWLFQPQGIEEIDVYHACVNHYIYADKWTERLYDEST